MFSQQGLRKALGSLKDSTSVGLARFNSGFKELDIAVVKATSHIECPPKEVHVSAIFVATSAMRPRADVAYCIHALARRLAKTHNWTVALKTLILIHRILREGDPTFREELMNYCYARGQILNMSQFKDDSSTNAWEYSAWVRKYALFLQERLECFRVLQYDVETEPIPRTKELDTIDLLLQLPALQQLLHHLTGCQPEGASFFNHLLHFALNMVLTESIKLCQAIRDGISNLVDKFFEMQRQDAILAFEMYKRSVQQTQELSTFYKICKGFAIARSLKFPSLEQPPQSFLSAMEEYVRESLQKSTAVRSDISDGKDRRLAIEYTKPSESEMNAVPEPPSRKFIEEAPPNENCDLLDINEPRPGPSSLDESNASAFAIVPSGFVYEEFAAGTTPNGSTHGGSYSSNLASGTAGWELALVETQSSGNSALTESKMGGGFDHLTLDSLYEDGMRRRVYPVQDTYGVNYTPNPHDTQVSPMDPFYASNKITPPPSVQMATLQQQQETMMMMRLHSTPNPHVMHPYMMQHSYPPGFLLPQNHYQQQNYQQLNYQQQTNPFGNTGLL